MLGHRSRPRLPRASLALACLAGLLALGAHPAPGPAVLSVRGGAAASRLGLGAHVGPTGSPVAPWAREVLGGSHLPPPAYGTYAWPVRGPVLRGFEQPEGPYGPGHRGIDIGVPLGAPVLASQDGVVAFAGWVGGSLFLSIDHPDGVRTTYSWLSEVRVRRGDQVSRGQPVAASGAGHPGVDPPHLHFGARVGDLYIDPMLLLERGSLVGLVHLAPLVSSPEPAARGAAVPPGPLP